MIEGNSLVITALSDEKRKNALLTYVSRGKKLCKTPLVAEISENIRQESIKIDTKKPKFFYFLEASSGEGKSQLAESLLMPVVYIPLGEGQPIYKCFEDVSKLIIDALIVDLINLRDKFKKDVKSANELYSSPWPLETVGVLIELFQLVFGKTNEESVKILSGYNGKIILKYKPTTLVQAREKILEFLMVSAASSCGSDSANEVEFKVPLFFIDEVPAADNNEEYARCILLRNIIRCMNCVCLLSGTEAAAMNAIDKIVPGSRSEDVDYKEYIRLILKLPRYIF